MRLREWKIYMAKRGHSELEALDYQDIPNELAKIAVMTCSTQAMEKQLRRVGKFGDDLFSWDYDSPEKKKENPAGRFDFRPAVHDGRYKDPERAGDSAYRAIEDSFAAITKVVDPSLPPDLRVATKGWKLLTSGVHISSDQAGEMLRARSLIYQCVRLQKKGHGRSMRHLLFSESPSKLRSTRRPGKGTRFPERRMSGCIPRSLETHGRHGHGVSP